MLLLVGTGNMARAYAQVLLKQRIKFIVVGNSQQSVNDFNKELNLKAIDGGLAKFIQSDFWINIKSAITHAIVATNVVHLTKMTAILISERVPSILVEKPAGLTIEDIKGLSRNAQKSASKIFVGYNRRFYESTRAARDIITDDGGVSSLHFNFTEVTKKIEVTKTEELKSNWFNVNSTHVIDMAFHLAGQPVSITAKVLSDLCWHPAGSVFAGCGHLKSGGLFSYHANWNSPGRWSIEIFTSRHRLIFCPLEKLRFQQLDGFDVKNYQLEDRLDVEFKPGIFRQVEHFIAEDSRYLLPLNEHLDQLSTYQNMLLQSQK